MPGRLEDIIGRRAKTTGLHLANLEQLLELLDRLGWLSRIAPPLR